MEANTIPTRSLTPLAIVQSAGRGVLWIALALVAILFTSQPAFAQAYGGYNIDGTVPDAGTVFYDDPEGNTDELGPINGAPYEIQTINRTNPPVLGLTTPNGKTDFMGVWLDTNVDVNTGDIWLYFAFQREASNGAGSNFIEFQQAGLGAACDYSQPNSTVINSCNPWANRQPGDFMIIWDQDGQSISIIKRVFTYTDNGNGVWDGKNAEPLFLGPPVSINGATVKGATSADRLYGELALNLSATVFPPTPTACMSVANIIPGTVTGNSESGNFSADVKDVVLFDSSNDINISNCGQVRITKHTQPAGLTGSFPFTLKRADNSPLEYGGNPAIQKTGTLTGHNDAELLLNLKVGSNYTLAEGALASPWELTGITCTVNGTNYNVYPGGQNFPVIASTQANCTITNLRTTGQLVVVKELINDNGGTLHAGDFDFVVTGSFPVNNGQPQPFAASGINTLTVPAGTYTVTEPAATGYVTSYANCANVQVTKNGTTTCTITNNDHPAAIDIRKNAEGADSQQIVAGSTVNWTIVVSNTGQVVLNNVTVTDPVAPNCAKVIGTLNPGQVHSYTCTLADVETNFTNVATVTGSAPTGANPTDNDPSSVDVTHPGIDIRKNEEGPDSQQVVSGGTVTWTIVVSNTGDVPLTNVAVSDPLAPACDATIGTLAAGASHTYTCALSNVTADLINVATVTGNAPVGPNVTDSDPSSVGVISPGISIRKNAAGPDTQQVLMGAIVTWTIVVSNTGDVPLTDVEVIDPLAPSCDATIGTLAAGASHTYTCALNNVNADFENIATVTGETPLGAELTDSDPSTVDVIHPSIDISKNAEGADTQTILTNTTASWTIRVENTGDVPLTDVTVTDPNAPACAKSIGTLAAGAVYTYTCSLPNVQADLINIATVTGRAPVGPDKSDSDPSSVDVISPALAIAKTGTAGPVTIDDMVDYTITVQNTGDVPLSNVTVNDTKLGISNFPVGTLAVGEVFTLTDSYGPVTEAMLPGPIFNTASATGKDPNGGTVGPVDDDHEVAIDIDPVLTIVKTGTTGPVEMGDTVDYTITVKNMGDVTLYDVTVDDAKLGISNYPVGTLAVGEVYTLTGSYGPVDETDLPGPIVNTAQAAGRDPNEEPVKPVTDTHSVAVTTSPAIRIVKSTNGADANVAPGPYISVGDPVIWQYVVTNAGNVSLTDIEVTDDMGVNPVYVSGDVDGDDILDLDETWVYSATGVATAGPYVNIGTARGTDPINKPVNATDPSHYFGLTSGLNIEKTGTAGPVKLGDTLVYTITVRNTGNTTLDDVTVKDSKLGINRNIGSLSMNQSFVITDSYGPVGESDLPGPIFNTASATGIDPNNQTVGPVTDTHEIEIGIFPALEIDKTGTTRAVEVGDTVDYTITVQNTGDVTLYNVTIDDAMLGIHQNIGTLGVNQLYTMTASYGPVTEAMLPGPIFNTAGVTATTPITTPVGPVTDTHEVPVNYFPALAIVKTGTAGPVGVGDTVDYTITVQNTGDVTLYNVTVDDALLGLTGHAVGTLGVGQVVTLTDSYGPITEADLPGPIFNTALAAGNDPTGTPTQPVTDTHEVPVSYAPTLTLDKTGTPGPVKLGDTVAYTITVKNTGDVTLYNVTVDDALLGLNGYPVGTLGVNQLYTITGSYGPVDETDLPGPIFNTAIAEGIDPTEAPVGPVTDTHEVPIQIVPGLAIDKTGTAGPAKIGDTVVYTITVQNTGDVTLYNVTVVDAMLGLNQNIGMLAVGQTFTLTDSYGPVSEADLPGPIFNIAGVTATTPTHEPTGPVTDTHEIPVQPNPGFTIDKTGTPGPVSIGDTVVYTITVQNTGDVALSNVKVVDAKLNLDQLLPSLPAGQAWVVTGSYGPITAADLPGPVFNTALATADGPQGPEGPITDTHEIPIVVSALGNRVWEDTNANGVQDDGEVGLSNVTVNLYRITGDTAQQVGTTTTNAEGLYAFTNLAPGIYVVEFVPPAGKLFGPQNQGGDDAKDSDADPATGKSENILLLGGESNDTIDAALYTPAPDVVSLGDRVWLDSNQNGLQDEGEVGVPGMQVTLYRADGTAVATTVTNADGFYLFDAVAPGSYFVGFAKPQGFVFTAFDVEANSQDTADSDARVPALTLTVASSTDEVALGNRMTYTLSYGNADSQEPAVNVVLSTTVPAGATFLPEASTAGWACEGSATTAGTHCMLAVSELAPGAQGAALFVVQLGTDDLQVPDAIKLAMSIAQETPARTGVVMLTGGAQDLSLDAGIYPAGAISTETPRRPGPTDLDEVNQPQGPILLFLPSVQR